MTLPTSGPISIGMVAQELGITLPLSLGDSRVRTLAGKPSGPISLGDLRGKSAATSMTVTAAAVGEVKNSAAAAGTANGTATATVTGGAGTKRYQWVVLSNPGGATVSGLTSQQMGASKAYARFATGSANVQVRCDVTDDVGTVSSNVVTIPLSWENAA